MNCDEALNVRKTSIETLEQLGFVCPDPGILPILDVPIQTRPAKEIVDRCLARAAAVAVSYGWPAGAALRWLERHELTGALADTERAVVVGQLKAAKDALLAGPESLWALTWSLGHIEDLDFASTYTDRLLAVLPDLDSGEDPSNFRSNSRLRPNGDIVAALDLAYCLDWSVVEARLAEEADPGLVSGYVILERRHALEWIVADSDWDDVALDT